MAEFGFLLVVMLLVMGGYWSFFVYPRQREFNQRQKYVRSLHMGDEVITFGGVVGRVVGMDAETGVVNLEIAEGVVIKVIAASVVSEYDPKQLAENTQRALNDEPTEKR
ncbi:MAG: preprotein translocase subunit YajC [Phototrophicaceae bacterium]